MHKVDKYTLNKPRPPKNIEEALDAFLVGCVGCYKKELFWQDDKKRFFILKHSSHMLYHGRFDGSKRCHAYYMLCDIKDKRNTTGNYAYGDIGVKCLKIFTGRWKKSNFDEVHKLIKEKVK